jgi:dTDP-4-amino-4,6-dideoxy-D-galactose acyltransferase
MHKLQRMKLPVIEILEWDSVFFGYPVGKVEILDENISEIKNIITQIIKGNIRICYLFVSPDNTKANNLIIKMGGTLFDQKTTMSKETEKHTIFSNDIIEKTDQNLDEKIKLLALSAGSFSRFKLDNHFKNNEFERLYCEWISKSLKKEIAIKTFIAKENSNSLGLITLGKIDTTAKIGLIAVDDHFKGRRIGSDLVRKADTESFMLGFKSIEVVTQLQNTAAINLYKKCNFEIDKITNVYHLWIS